MEFKLLVLIKFDDINEHEEVGLESYLYCCFNNFIIGDQETN